MIGGGDSLVGGQEGTFANGALTTTSAPYFMVDSGATTNAYNFSGGKFTGSVWAKSNRVTRTTRFFNIQGSAPGAAYAEPTNAVQLIPVSAAVRARYSAGSTYNNATNAGTLVANTWSYLTMVVSRGTADTAKLYSNGALVQTVTSSTVLLPDTVRNYVFLGRGFGSATDSVFSGVMDEMTLANASRTPDWIMLSYKNQKIGVAPVFDLSYSVPTATYTVGSAITANNPTLTGSATRYVVSPALPTGLTISSSTGVISGTPTGSAASAANYTITALSDSAWSTTATVSITILPAVPTVAYAPTSVSYRAGDVISKLAPLIATNGEAPVISVSPSLPFGLSLNSTTGVVTGVAASPQGAAAYVFTATNSAGSSMDTVTITVTAGEDYSTWAHFSDMTLNTTASSANIISSGLGNIPVLVRLTSAHLTVFSQALSTGADIRFANASGSHLAYQLERWSFAPGDTSAAIWVLADTVAANGTTNLRMYWGNGSATDDSRATTVFDTANGFSSVWHFNEASASSYAVEATANGDTATQFNSPATVSAVIGGGRNFNGTGTASSNNYFKVPQTAATAYLSPTSQITVSTWLNAGSNSANDRRVFQKTSTDANNRMIFNNGTATWNLSSTTLTATLPTPNTGTWRLLHAVYNGANMSIYVDGKRISNVARTGSISTGNDTNGFWIGSKPTTVTATDYFQGNMDEFRYARVGRDSNWVRLEYKNQKPGVTPVFNLSYPVSSPAYTNAVPIPVNTPTVVGSATRFAIDSSLPVGLSFNTTTGAITGTPTAVFSGRNYTVTAYGDSAWSTATMLNISVSANAGPPTNLTYSPSTMLLGV
ncbi:MAG TPA: hypothetical protein DCQ83_07500, partial [Fibrobacteres bacterium]|nr:hypothetical protein [Fibrobacterota bacterium]